MLQIAIFFGTIIGIFLLIMVVGHVCIKICSSNKNKNKYDLKKMHIRSAYDFGGHYDRARLDEDYYTMKEMAKMVANDEISFDYVPSEYESKVMHELMEQYHIDLYKVRVSHPRGCKTGFYCGVCGTEFGVSLRDICPFCGRIIDKDVLR